MSQSFCLQFDPRGFLKREHSSEIFSSNQSNTRQPAAMNNVDPDTQRWVFVSLKEEEKKVKWMGRGRGGWGFLPAFRSCIVQVLFGC